MASPTSQLWPTNSTTRANIGLAIRHGNITISDPLSSTATHNGILLDQEISTPTETLSNRADGTWPRISMPPIHVRSASNPHDESDMQNRISLGPSIIMSSLSSAPSKNSLSQTRQGGLRATLKRMFGSKRNRVPVTESSGQSLKNGSEATGPPVNYSYGQSRLRRSVTKSSALGSHAVQTFMADGAGAASDLDTDNQPYYKRRNTLPSLIFSDAEAQSISKSLSGLQDTHALHHQQDLSQSRLHTDRRRSRSAEALSQQHHTHQRKPSHTRDRSSTITYWRNSMASDPMPKVIDMPVKDVHAHTLKSRSNSKSHLPQDSPLEPVQSFDFGLTASSAPVDLEERVNTLEVKMFDFEYAIAKLQGIELPKPVLPLRTIRKRSVPQLLSSTAGSSNSLADSTFSQPQTSVPISFPKQSSRQVPDSRETLQSTYDVSQPNRDSQRPTIRPNTSHGGFSRSTAPSPTSVRLTHDQFDKLMIMIQNEKLARQQIEMQIIDLQKEVELLQAPVYATIKPLDFSKSPYSDSSHNQADNETTPIVARRAKTLHRKTPFEFTKPPPLQRDVSRFSMTESDAGSMLSDDTYDEESYRTPQENSFRFESNRGSPLIAS